jgi:transcriptional regulator with GAF, ATPase, and Fis domain
MGGSTTTPVAEALLGPIAPSERQDVDTASVTDMAEHEHHELELAEMFGEIARTLLSEHDLAPTLDKILELAVTTIASCEHAGFSMVKGRSISSLAASDAVPGDLDRVQAEEDEGPCLDAIREHRVFQTGALSDEVRWPRFAARGHAETGVESILSIRLFAEHDTMGALNLYSNRRDAFDEHDVALASVFAAHAAVAMATARERGELHAAIDSRDLIGQAKGILMARHHITADQAFDLLRRTSQQLNLKLRDIADSVAETGELPEK